MYIHKIIQEKLRLTAKHHCLVSDVTMKYKSRSAGDDCLNGTTNNEQIWGFKEGM